MSFEPPPFLFFVYFNTTGSDSIYILKIQFQYCNINIIGMSRHRRSNSDLYGLKSLRNSKSSSFREQDKPVSNHNLSDYEIKSATIKKSNCPQTPTKKTDTQETILDTYRLLKHFYQNDDLEYFNRVKKYLKGQWETHKKNFNEHFNKLIYMQEEMHKKNYPEIQLEIIGQWRKNPVLYSLRVFWYEFVEASKFSSIGDFTKRYNLFKDFIGQIAFLYFKRFFISLGNQKQIQKVLDKLTERTSHLIITNTTTWCKVCQKIVFPLIKEKLELKNIQSFKNSQFDLEKLGVKTIAVNISAKQMQMPKTVESIQKFISELKMYEKMNLLIKIRQNMQQQIKKRQEKLIFEGQINGIKILDKDDFVDCLVYCVVKGNISLIKLGLSLKYFYYVLGPDASNLLSKFRCDPYLADLEAVFDFLTSQKQEDKQNSIGNSNKQTVTSS